MYNLKIKFLRFRILEGILIIKQVAWKIASSHNLFWNICQKKFQQSIINFGLIHVYFLQEFQRELVKAAETFTSIGYKHIEAGENCKLLSIF